MPLCGERHRPQSIKYPRPARALTHDLSLRSIASRANEVRAARSHRRPDLQWSCHDPVSSTISLGLSTIDERPPAADGPPAPSAADARTPTAASRDPRRAPPRTQSGLAPGRVQGNLVVLPAPTPTTSCATASADRGLPVLAVTRPGDPQIAGARRRPTCAPTCRATGSGETAGSRARSTISPRCGATTGVGFVIGCSFSFEQRCSNRRARHGAEG